MDRTVLQAALRVVSCVATHVSPAAEDVRLLRAHAIDGMSPNETACEIVKQQTANDRMKLARKKVQTDLERPSVVVTPRERI
jgi:hypothetical protein